MPVLLSLSCNVSIVCKLSYFCNYFLCCKNVSIAVNKKKKSYSSFKKKKGDVIETKSQTLKRHFRTI